MTLIKEPKKWYVKLFTLGKNFRSRTFSDNSKKFLLNAVVNLPEGKEIFNKKEIEACYYSSDLVLNDLKWKNSALIGKE
jgi:hypothetical protein